MEQTQSENEYKETAAAFLRAEDRSWDETRLLFRMISLENELPRDLTDKLFDLEYRLWEKEGKPQGKKEQL
mgnify:CR=1 FL=1